MQEISVKNLYKADVGATESFELTLPLDSFDLPEEYELITLSGKAKLMRLEESVHASGNFKASLKLICDRCLDNFEKKVEFEIDKEYFFDRKYAPEGEATVDKYLNIDLSDEIREELLLAIPIQNFCKEKCPGICSGCGVNLNHEACNCK